MLNEDSLHEECGVFGVFGCKDAAKLCYSGLYALQHRGQEGAGIVSYDRSSFYVVKHRGLVRDVFNPENIAYLKGQYAIGHVRYSTTGSGDRNNIQPLYSKTSKGRMAIAHNGNITNAYAIYKELKSEGALFQSTVDSETILHLFSRARGNALTAMKSALSKLEGAYSMVALGEDYMIAARDPNGFRPLVLGRLNHGYIVASETCALDLIGAKYIREILPGEILYITKEGIETAQIPSKNTPSMCIFEHVYFSRPDSIVFGDCSHEIRKAFGAKLALEHPVEADLVMSIPDSGNSAALGYAEQSGIPFEFGMTRNHYVGRTFIQPKQKIRDFSVKVKLNPIVGVLKGKRVIVVDDSVVRGTTSKHRIETIRQAGAKEIHLRISSPPIVGPCHFGVDTPDKKKLIAANQTLEEIREFIGCDSIGYLSRKGMLDCVKAYPPENFCTGCFTGKYPVRVRNKGKFAFESKYKIKTFEGD